MKILKGFEMVFEDFAIDEYGAWSYICKEHSANVPSIQLDVAGECDCLCGVEGCPNTSSTYVNFIDRKYVVYTRVEKNSDSGI